MQSSYKTCPRCGLTLASDVTICGRCGHRFTVEAAPIAPPPPLLLPTQEPGVPAPQTAPPLPQEPKQKVVAISLALGLGGIGAHGFYLGNKTMGMTLAGMCIGGGLLALFCLVLSLVGVSIWLTAIGLVPMLIAMTIPLIQAARYGFANSEQFQQWYVVEKRWF